MERRPCWRFVLDPAILWAAVGTIKLRWFPIGIDAIAGNTVFNTNLNFWYVAGSSNVWTLQSPDLTDFGPAGMTKMADANLAPALWNADGFGKQYFYTLTDAERDAVVAAIGSETILSVQPRVSPISVLMGFQCSMSSGGEAKEIQRPALIIEQLTTGSPRDRIYEEFEEGMGGATPIAFAGDNYTPTIGSSWTRLTVLHSGSAQDTIQEEGARKFMRHGEAIAQVFVPRNAGRKTIDEITTTARTALEGKTFYGTDLNTFDAIYMGKSAIREVGPDGGWHQYNVATSFQWEQAR